MAKNTLYNKVWDSHVVTQLPTGQYQLFIGLHLTHEVTTPQAYDMLTERGLDVAFRDRTVATVDHIIPTDDLSRPYADEQAEKMMQALEDNTKKFDVRFLDFDSGRQGIVHVIGPEMGMVHPGMTVACGDSHTATHGAFGTLSFGIGTSQVSNVLASQCLSVDPLKVRRVEVNGKLKPGVEAKDVTLYIIRKLGVNGGIGYAYEYAGDVFDDMSMEGRMTVCNMAIEGGARVGYCNPDETTFEYLKGREHSPSGENWDKAVAHWRTLASGADAQYDDVVKFDAADIEPMVTWGITPGLSIGVNEPLPQVADFEEEDHPTIERAYEHMGLSPGKKISDLHVDVVFIGSCTNSRISDLRTAANVAKGRQVASGVQAIVVPGSQQVKAQAEAEGLDKIFLEAGFEWRFAGCSMCLGMNQDKLVGDQVCASTSNRNFIGRQGSPTGRTLLMSPSMAAASAVTGHITDARELG
ncbi:MAG: 3-isopropylmalate dehydratase large subunit [Gammaproteobacteria bacterium]|nr:3-isopropylmalate dehydratase large subunit [Gammaproteobacteria bacterium]